MGPYGTVAGPGNRLRNMGLPAESRQAWFLGWQLWDDPHGRQLAGARVDGLLLILLHPVDNWSISP